MQNDYSNSRAPGINSTSLHEYSGDTPPYAVPCPVGGCQRTYTNDGSLRNHLRMAHSDRHMLPKANSRNRRPSPQASASSMLCSSPTAISHLDNNNGLPGLIYPGLIPLSAPDLSPHQMRLSGGDELNDSALLPGSTCSSLTTRRMDVDTVTPPFGAGSSGGMLATAVPWPWHARIINTSTAAHEPRARSFSHNVVVNNNQVQDGRQLLQPLARTSSSPALQSERTSGAETSSSGGWSPTPSQLTMDPTESFMESATRRLQALADLSARIAVHADEVKLELIRAGEISCDSRSPRNTPNSPRLISTPRTRTSLAGPAPYHRASLHTRRFTDPHTASRTLQVGHDTAMNGMNFGSPGTPAHVFSPAALYAGPDFRCDQLMPAGMNAVTTHSAGILSAAPNSSLSSTDSNAFTTATTYVPSRDSQLSSEGPVDFKTQDAAEHHAFLNLVELWQLLQADLTDTPAAGVSDMTDDSTSHEDETFISDLAIAMSEF